MLEMETTAALETTLANLGRVRIGLSGREIDLDFRYIFRTKRRHRGDRQSGESGSVTYSAVHADSVRRVQIQGQQQCTLGWRAHGISKNGQCAN